MIPDFNRNGHLPPGIHWARREEALETAPVDGTGSGVGELEGSRLPNGSGSVDGELCYEQAELPNDYDACWEEAGVDPETLDPVLLTFDAGRATQKAKYFGESFPASVTADPEGLSFLEFFRTDKETGEAKGIVAIDLGGALR